jgi:hypothetical protein
MIGLIGPLRFFSDRSLTQKAQNAMSESEDIQVWNAVRDFLIQSSRRLAYGQEPWVIYSSSRDNRHDTEPGANTEHKFAAEIDEMIRQFITQKQWPDRSKSVVRFYAGQRIAWACDFLRIMLTPASNGEVIFPRPFVSGLELIEWLLITAYHSRFERQPRFANSQVDAGARFARVWP